MAHTSPGNVSRLRRSRARVALLALLLALGLLLGEAWGRFEAKSKLEELFERIDPELDQQAWRAFGPEEDRPDADEYGRDWDDPTGLDEDDYWPDLEDEPAHDGTAKTARQLAEEMREASGKPAAAATAATATASPSADREEKKVDEEDLQQARAASREPNEIAITLTSKNVDSMLASHRHALIYFYAPWCGHCHKMAPEFEAAARVLE